MSVRSFLVTGPNDSLNLFGELVWNILNHIDGRGETQRFTCMADHSTLAVDSAKRAGVTLQEIIVTGHELPGPRIGIGGGTTVAVSECTEEYPVLYLAPHGMKWEARCV